MTFGEPTHFYTYLCNTVDLFTLESYQLFISLCYRSRTNWRICSRRPNTACTNLTIRHPSKLHQPTAVRNRFSDVPLVVLHTPSHGSKSDLPEQISPNSAYRLLAVCALAIFPPNSASSKLRLCKKPVWPAWIVHSKWLIDRFQKVKKITVPQFMSFIYDLFHYAGIAHPINVVGRIISRY